MTAAAWAVKAKKCLPLRINSKRNMILKRDALGLTTMDEFYDYVRSIFVDINKCMEGN